jgi:hypothetical protein
MRDEFADHPPIGSAVDLIPTSRSDTVMGWVEDLRDDDLVVSLPLTVRQWPMSLRIGERLEVVWRAGGDLRALSVEIVEVVLGERPQWRLRRAGVVRRGQRRDAVRAPMTAPVRIGSEPSTLSGVTVDLSEGGFRCVLERQRGSANAEGDAEDFGLPPTPDVGDVVRVSVVLPNFTATCLAHVIRRHPREDARTELSLRFLDLTDRQEDEIRSRVFTRLRDLRNRGLL